jgi:UDP-N-acetylmuramoyl-tripeptide--D-alanyl-D-alanine ligase
MGARASTAGGRTVAVLGEMRELGESSDAEHAEVGRLAVRLGIHQVVAVGQAARAVHLAARAERGRPGADPDDQGKEPVFVADSDAAVGWLLAHVRPGDVVLVKASRGARLDVVADALLRQDSPEQRTGPPGAGASR